MAGSRAPSWARRGGRRLSAGAALGALGALAWGAGASAAPVTPAAPPAPAPPSQPAAAAPEKAESAIVITAAPSERASIDRTTYTVRDTAEARTMNVFELLGQVPSLEVTPQGQLRMLGRSGVRILVDGVAVPNPQAFLRNLQASQVARIEVISNPSAQFSASGTGGVVNIITRRTSAPGVGGSASGSLDSVGGATVRLSPTWSRGDLSLSGSVSASLNRSRSASVQERESLVDDDALGGDRIELATQRNRNDSVNGNLFATYRLSPRRSLTLTASGSRSGSTTTPRSVARTRSGELLYRQTGVATNSGTVGSLGLDYRAEGSRKGETLTLSAKQQSFDAASRSVSSAEDGAGPVGEFRSTFRFETAGSTLKADYVRPGEGVRRLSIGAAFDRTAQIQSQQAEGVTPFGRPVPAMSERLEATWREAAAYVTYQFPVLGLTALPGLRVEDRRYRIVDAGGVGRPGGVHAFPSLHLERPLGKKTTGRLSYSRRISWPDPSNYRSVVSFFSPTDAVAGNPAEKPEITDSYEGKLEAFFGKQRLDATFYLRSTGDSLGYDYALVEGVLISRPVNRGRRRATGASGAMRGPLGHGFDYSLSADLARVDISAAAQLAGLGDDGLQYGGSLQLDYRDGAEGKPGADHVMVNLRYSGPADYGVFRNSGFLYTSASWSHAFNRRLSAVLAVSDPFAVAEPRFVSRSLAVVSRSYSRARRQATLSLTWSIAPPAAK